MKKIIKNKKTHRERKRYRERKLISIKLDLPRKYLLYLREESLKRKLSINKILDIFMREAMNADSKELEQTQFLDKLTKVSQELGLYDIEQGDSNFNVD